LEVNNIVVESVSGDIDWREVILELSEGPNSVAWIYRKDSSVDRFEDSAWVDGLQVLSFGDNRAPVLDAIAKQTASALVELSFTAVASDVDLPAQQLRYSLKNAPPGALIEPATGVFSWTPTEAQAGSTYTFYIEVTDGELHDSVQIAIDVLGRSETWYAEATELGDGWYSLGFFGSFNVSSDPWIFHTQHGWIYCFGDNPDGLYFWDPEMHSFLYASWAVYPAMYRLSDDTWIWYQKGSKNPRWFLDLKTDMWFKL
jgi:hypothetical protein